MSARLRVEELRAELRRRGLVVSGNKSALVRRLNAAIRKEEKAAVAAAATTVADGDGEGKGGNKRKRKRTGDEEEEGNGDTSSEAAKLEGMRYRELQRLAKARGIAANWGKKELRKRLLSVLVNAVPVVDGGVQDKKEATKSGGERVEEELKKENRTAIFKGAAVLDQHITDHIKRTYHVLQVGDDIYDASLNQTNVENNNNKFYIIQALESDDGRRFMVYKRWGRVGATCGKMRHGPFKSRDKAISLFEKKFHDETNNLWSNRKKFKCYANKYIWIEMDYNQTEGGHNNTESNGSLTNQIRTKLETRIGKFISLICSISMMQQQMVEIGYNADKLPLGKLSKSTIRRGYALLKMISDVISRADRTQLKRLTGEFYSVIPHDIGYCKMSEFIIDTPQKLKAELEMVEALGEIEIARKLLKGISSDENYTFFGMAFCAIQIDLSLLNVAESEDDPLYAKYKQLQCELEPIEVDSEEYSMIKNYLINTHGITHSDYTVDIVQIFKVSRQGETQRFQKFANSENRMLLWHGSRLSNWTGILSQGLRIAPPEAPVTGYMFGKGVYFADMFSKSANYCHGSDSSRSGVLLLCEVALGDMNELINGDYNAHKLPKGKLSTKGVGKIAPNLANSIVTKDGVVVPLGKPKVEPSKQGSLVYNEYIVYNVDQIIMRYVLHVSFNFKRHKLRNKVGGAVATLETMPIFSTNTLSENEEMDNDQSAVVTPAQVTKKRKSTATEEQQIMTRARTAAVINNSPTNFALPRRSSREKAPTDWYKDN